MHPTVQPLVGRNGRPRRPLRLAAAFGFTAGLTMGLLGHWGGPTPVGAIEPEDQPQVSSRDALVETHRESDHLLGDARGWRSRLVGQGIHFQAGYIGETMGNVSGGIERGMVYNGLVEAALDLEFGRLTDRWQDGRFRVSGIFPHGRSPSGKLVGDVQTVSNIDGYDSVSLYELWLEQDFWQKRVSLRLGQLLADAEFAGTSYGGVLLNSSFGWPAFISGSTRNTGPAYYRAALGARVRVALGDALDLQAGIYDGDSIDDPAGRPSRNPHGVNFELSEQQGAFVIGEAVWKLNQEEKSEGLPGTYKLGGWLHTARFADQLNPARNHRSNFGLYVAAEQMVWRESGADKSPSQGLGLFFRAGGSPADRNVFSFACDGGLHYHGLLPGREDDVLAVGLAYVQISDDFRRGEKAAGATILSDHELALEVSYQMQLKPWWSVQPDLQWIHHPGGSRALADALVVGLRTRITF